jgi:RNA polymerase sigma-70 factor (ECF subfamily)
MSTESDSPPEAELLAALRRGESHAYAELVQAHGDYLYRVAMRMTGNAADAGDAVQEAFISAFRSIDGFEGRATLRTWLHRMTVNAALMRLRARTRRNEVSIDELAPEFEGLRGPEPHWAFVESSEDMLARAGVRAAVTAAIDRLPDAYRVVVILRDIEDLDTREVAELLGDTEGTIKVRLHRARAALKKLLEPVYLAQAGVR